MSSPRPRSLLGMIVFMGLMTIAWSANALQAAPAAGLFGAVAGVLLLAAAGVIRLRARGLSSAPVATSAATAPSSASLRAPASDGEHREREAPGPPRIRGAALGLIVLVEVCAIAAVVAVLGGSGRGDLVMPAVAAVVAAHFALFLLVQREILHLATAVVGLLGAGAALGLVAGGGLDPAAGRALAGLSLALCTLAYGVVFCLIEVDSQNRIVESSPTCRNPEAA